MIGGPNLVAIDKGLNYGIKIRYWKLGETKVLEDNTEGINSLAMCKGVLASNGYDIGYRVSYGRSNSTTRRSQWCALATEEEFVVSRSTDQILRVWSHRVLLLHWLFQTRTSMIY